MRGKRKRKGRRWLKYLLYLLMGMVLGAGVMAFALVYRAAATLPTFGEIRPSQSSVILDNQGEIIYRLVAEENRTTIKDINQIPKEVRLAFVAVEDRRFYSHHGVDPIRLAGATLHSLQYFLGVEGSQLEGGSTITMQLARNAFLSPEQTVMRKLQEIMIALELEKIYDKDEILLLYLNQVPFGGQAYGLEAAAQTYFSKNASELTLSEGAMLAGMLKAPSYYNPITNYEGAMFRRAIVLDLMAEYGFISEEQAEQLKAEEVVLNPSDITPTTVTFTGDWYVDYVITILTDPEVARRYGMEPLGFKSLYNDGLKIYTAMDRHAQQVAQEKLEQMLPEAAVQYGGRNAEVPQGAVVVMDPTTGEVKALVGGLRHEAMLSYNRATQAYRQPGSAIKPIVAYLPAIDYLGWGPGTVIDDSPITVTRDGSNQWPVNYQRAPYLGLKPMRYGVEQSLNTMAVRALNAVTPEKAIDYAHAFGLTSIIDETHPSPNDAGLALALGGLTRGVTVLDLTAAYGAVANMGVKVDPVVITRIEDADGRVIFEAHPETHRVAAPESAYLMIDILKGVIRRGTAASGTGGFHGWPAGGKTGTTEDWHDAWFVGFTPTLVTGIWTGYDNLTERKALPGQWTGAGPPVRIWTAIMNELVTEPPADWPRPSGVVSVQICKTSGMRPSPNCPADDLTWELFRKGTEPKQDNVWTTATVVKSGDRYVLWEPGCPGNPEVRHFIRRPNTYAKHPKAPNNTAYWPQDWVLELPTVSCRDVGGGAAGPDGTGGSSGDQGPGWGEWPGGTGGSQWPGETGAGPWPGETGGQWPGGSGESGGEGPGGSDGGPGTGGTASGPEGGTGQEPGGSGGQGSGGTGDGEGPGGSGDEPPGDEPIRPIESGLIPPPVLPEDGDD